jgi:chorismate dehydratase
LRKAKLKVGRIPYANLLPIYYYLDNQCGHEERSFTKGVPSKLNRMLREGELDISPSSSIEYLKNKNKYRILPWLSVSSSGPIKSILLFSTLPIEDLGGKTISVTSDSETSAAMLKIILKEVYALKCRFQKTDLHSVKNILSSSSAVLHIGDTAMLEAKKAASRIHPSPLHIYDLGEIWNRHTGLPFVYALWVVRKKVLLEKRDLINRLSDDLISAKKYASKHLSLVAREAPQKKWISEKELIDYWNIISYDFTEKHMEGLLLFEKYALRKN